MKIWKLWKLMKHIVQVQVFNTCVELFPFTPVSYNGRPVSWVGRAPNCRAEGRGFKPRPDQHSGSLSNRGERAAFVIDHFTVVCSVTWPLNGSNLASSYNFAPPFLTDGGIFWFYWCTQTIPTCMSGFKTIFFFYLTIWNSVYTNAKCRNLIGWASCVLSMITN